MRNHFDLQDFSAIQAEAHRLTEGKLAVEDRARAAGSRAAFALSVYQDASIPTPEVWEAAQRAVQAKRGSVKSTFVPIFTTNHCDSECRMCGMRRSNIDLNRKFSGRRKIEEQLAILYEVDRVRGVGFLTGEYEGEYTRKANAFLIGWAIRRALDMGFEIVYYNIGSLTPDEIGVLAEWVEPDEAVTMCVFQETYHEPSYVKFMGRTDPHVPKSDFGRRIRSFDNWLDAGYKHVNPGFLVGLHRPEVDLAQLAAHVAHLDSRGASVRISLPRLRPALGVSARSVVPDDEYLRLIATVALSFPEHPIVLTTRETQEFQDSVLPLVGVISPGSPDVSPYKRAGQADNEPTSSQFVIPDLRRPVDILERITGMGYTIENFARA